MRKYLIPLSLMSLLVVACNNGGAERTETPADFSQGTSSSPNDIQREEDVSGADSEEGSDIGTNRGAGSAAGSDDAAGMGMDE